MEFYKGFINNFMHPKSFENDNTLSVDFYFKNTYKRISHSLKDKDIFNKEEIDYNKNKEIRIKNIKGIKYILITFLNNPKNNFQKNKNCNKIENESIRKSLIKDSTRNFKNGFKKEEAQKQQYYRSVNLHFKNSVNEYENTLKFYGNKPISRRKQNYQKEIYFIFKNEIFQMNNNNKSKYNIFKNNNISNYSDYKYIYSHNKNIKEKIDLIVIKNKEFTIIIKSKIIIAESIIEKNSLIRINNKEINSASNEQGEFEIKKEGKETLENYLIQMILKLRIQSVNTIIKNFRLYKETKLKYSKIFIDNILNQRNKSAIFIQSSFRTFIAKTSVNKLINLLKENCIFIYDYNGKYIGNSKRDKNSSEEDNYEIHDIKLKLINTRNKKNNSCENILNFIYSKILKSYMLIFKKKGLIRRHYKVNFIIDGYNIIDPRYKIDLDHNGIFFNIIESNLLLSKNKIKSYENKLLYLSLKKENRDPFQITSFNINKFYNNQDKDLIEYDISLSKIANYWEELFKIKNSIDNNKLQNEKSVNYVSDIKETHNIFNLKNDKKKKDFYSTTPKIKINKEHKSCIKKLHSSNEINFKKTVSFNENVKISFFSI